MYKVGSTNYHLEIDPACIRQALHDWSSLKLLGENPSAKTELISQRQEQCGYTNTIVGRGLALREVLQEAILNLKPEQAAPKMEDKRWRPYFIVSEQYLNGRSPDWLREQLHISRATYYLEQQRALETLTGILQAWQERAAAERIAVRSKRETFSDSDQKAFLVPPQASQPLFGRDELFAGLKDRLLERGRSAFVALYGLPGVGKTSLAIELLHDPETRDEFEDGILWAGLGQHPNPLAILGTWAAELGITPEVIAYRDTLEERANLIRTAIGLRRLLIVVDDAWQIETALSFKLGGPNCSYLLTTRHANLAVEFAGAAQAYRVEELSEEDGFALLSWFASAAVNADPAAAADLVSSVGALPLALVLMGYYLQVQSANEQPRRIKQALEFLRHQNSIFQLQIAQSPLESRPDFPPGSLISLEAIIGLSESALTQTAQQALLDLSLFPSKPDSFSEKAALAVCACSTEELDVLVDSGLLEPVPHDHYCMHQTISDYAALKFSDLPAVGRLIDYYYQWLSKESKDFQINRNVSNIAKACQQGFRYGVDRPAIFLVNAIFDFLERQGLYDLAFNLLEPALETANRLEEPALQAELLLKMGDIEVRRGRFKVALNYLEQSLPLAQHNGLMEIETASLFQLGLAKLYTGEPQVGFDALSRTLQASQRLENVELQCYSLNGLGFACQESAQFERARAYLKEAMCLADEYGFERGKGWTHQNLCMIEIQTGQYDLARENSRICLQTYQAIGDRRGSAWQMYHEARIDRQVGNYNRAALGFKTVLDQLDELDDWMARGFCLHNMGLLKAESGYWRTAWQDYQDAQQVFGSIDCKAGLAQCLHSFAQLRRKGGDPQSAIPLLETALELRRKISFRRGAGMSAAVRAISLYESGQVFEAFEEAHCAVDLFRTLETPASLAYALTFLGRMQMGNENYIEAVSAFKEALRLRAQLKQTHLFLELQAGLAYSAQQSGQKDLAFEMVKDAWPLLEQEQSAAGLQIMDQIAWVFLYLGKTLDLQGDAERANAVWQWGIKRIQRQLDYLPPETTAFNYLQRIPENRELLALATQQFWVGGENSGQL